MVIQAYRNGTSRTFSVLCFARHVERSSLSTSHVEVVIYTNLSSIISSFCHVTFHVIFRVSSYNALILRFIQCSSFRHKEEISLTLNQIGPSKYLHGFLRKQRPL